VVSKEHLIWEYIKSGNHSLEPDTNINILFDRLMEGLEEQIKKGSRNLPTVLLYFAEGKGTRPPWAFTPKMFPRLLKTSDIIAK
jgi:hypothetical protein